MHTDGTERRHSPRAMRRILLHRFMKRRANRVVQELNAPPVVLLVPIDPGLICAHLRLKYLASPYFEGIRPEAG
jgi:hypothetical protein